MVELAKKSVASVSEFGDRSSRGRVERFNGRVTREEILLKIFSGTGGHADVRGNLEI